MDAYADRVCAEMRAVRGRVAGFAQPREFRDVRAVELPGQVDSIYLGGGTPSLLSADQVGLLFRELQAEFKVSAEAEITLECAPGQVSGETLDAMLRVGMNRISFGVQSFVDSEAAAVGRLHTRAMCLDEIARMRTAGIENLNVDLIVGLPRQTRESWRESVDVAIASGVPHISVYMLEVDEDSRLGREVLAAGKREQGTGSRLRYSADAVPSDDAIAEWYAPGCEWLEAAGIRQYEISNFARTGFQSRHNIRYWRRGPYLGFGLDAHSMLRCGTGAVRWANEDDLDRYEAQGSRFEAGTRGEDRVAEDLGLTIKGDEFRILPSQGAEPRPEWIGREQGFEEAMFLGLRMNEGVDMDVLRAEFGAELVTTAMDAASEIEEAGLVEREGSRLRLTARGRMVSNEVFSRLLVGVVV